MTRDEKWLLDEKYHGIGGPGFDADRHRLALGEPLAYVIGWQPFLGLKIYLDSRPLIPRPETEWWTEELAGTVNKGPLKKILDLCAGSGAIGCAILKLVPSAQVSFGELIPEHAATIRKNIAENGLDAARADVRIGDLYAPFAGERFDVIAVNPPYIREGRALPASVADYEPPEALYGGNDGLALIRRIAEGAAAHLNPGGKLWMECDAENASAAAAHLTLGSASYTELRTDPYGRPRLIVGYYA